MAPQVVVNAAAYTSVDRAEVHERRMQFVDVTAGLLERWMGIATVRMHTAAAATDATIPGLPTAEAALLRDRLAHKGEERSMGL